MNLSCYELRTPLEINEDKISTLVIENPTFYRNFISDMFFQTQNISSRFTLSQADEIMNFSKCVEIVSDIFNLPFNSRLFQSKINQIVTEEINISNIKTTDIINKINELGSVTVTQLGLDIAYTPISDISGIVKLLGFYFDSESLSFSEKIIEYLNFLNAFTEKRLFVIINLKSALSENEFNEFTKLVLYKKIRVLLIENNNKYSCNNENIRIIDNDLCEI